MRNAIVNAALGLGLLAMELAAGASATAQDKARRGEYLATIMDCAGCHTPGALTGKPDTARHLGGAEVGFELPGMGIFYPPNLTPDRETGLGAWSEGDIVTAVRTGARPDGRILAPVMPYHNYARLTDADAQALAVYLKSLKPVRNKVPEIRGPGENATAPYLTVMMPK